ncbi:MAG: hypothetical protein LBU11_11545 [Zoogloeaceae bacterium]|jgi:hypothetical protein|nr:hypothetical protein [Zoogloeaceae bacterium]
MKSSRIILLACAMLAFSGCKTLEDAVQILGNGNDTDNSPVRTATRLPIPESIPAAEDCGAPDQLIRTVSAAQKKNKITAKKTYDGKWCRLSGKLTEVGKFSVNIYQYPAIYLDKKLACIQAGASGMLGGHDPSPPGAERQGTEDVREKLIDMKGQKVEIVGQIKLDLYDFYTHNRYFPLIHCQIVSPKI